jgi:hypothetical protein
MKTIGIVGCSGFMGNAVCCGMKHAFEIIGYDKKDPTCIHHIGHGIDQGIGDSNPYFLMLEKVDGPIFICVPTPMNADGGSNINIVTKACKEIDEAAELLKKRATLIIKSTVPPGTTEKINEKLKNSVVVFNPEFLREATAIEDFKNQDRIIIGGPHEGTAIVNKCIN